MTSYEAFIDENVARWLEPAMLDEPSNQLDLFRSVVGAMSSDLADRELQAVLAAYGVADSEVQHWAGQHLRSADDAFVYEGKEELLRRLVALAVLRHVALDGDDAAVLCALAVQSAQFAELDPTLAELPDVCSRRVHELGRQRRSRTGPSTPVTIGSLPKTRKANEETGEPVDVNDLAADVGAHTKALRAFATAVEDALAQAASRQRSLDEEVEMLWWTLKNRDEQGVAWADQPAIERAVEGAFELATRTAQVPGPPSAQSLLRRHLSDEDGEATIAEVAEQIATRDTFEPLTGPTVLLPLSTASAVFRELRDDDDDKTWKKVLKKRIGLDPSKSTDLATASEQLYRELQMIRLTTG